MAWTNHAAEVYPELILGDRGSLALIAAAKERDDLRAQLQTAREVLELAENLMLAITGNEPDDLIADGGITVWHGIVVGAQNWLNIQWPKVEALSARATQTDTTGTEDTP